MSATTTRELVEIDERRLLRRLDDLAQRGALPQGGIYRPLYSPQWTSAMELVATWMKEAGLLVRRDPVGNVWGRIEGSRGGRVIATGSHVDTVRGGGALDGALGVVAGIEAVSSLWQRFGRSSRTMDRVSALSRRSREPRILRSQCEASPTTPVRWPWTAAETRSSARPPWRSASPRRPCGWVIQRSRPSARSPSNRRR